VIEADLPVVIAWSFESGMWVARDEEVFGGFLIVFDLSNRMIVCLGLRLLLRKVEVKSAKR
jgi:hypothetical protein